ncbi:PREDICTED: uncharacterized protein LOC104826579 [Tarenaya hassleriana]|uniref:uncharacterized protein LOC104826579 n=1 Tax=Tarenaya hassleriana TaxID=28532 RepID=UPI00053C0C8B|nr:PREDICTED: uncharacterized protein LOC104826579 [Tarenaya hassleriana]
MAGHERLPLRMKRKDIDRVNDDFSDFTLSSQARKIRRLDVDLPPIMEEDEAQMGMAMAKPVTEELNPEPMNEERAIVVYKPLQAHQSYCGNLHVDTDLISGFKNKFLRAGYYNDARLAYDDCDENPSNNCRAVVPYIPSQFPVTKSAEPFQQPHELEITEVDETGEDVMMEEATMEIKEGSNSSMPLPQEPEFKHWQQQQQQQPHCMIPQLPQTNSTPISWSP